MGQPAIVSDDTGKKVVLISDIIFMNKQNIDWHEVEVYLEQHIGEIFKMAETKDINVSSGRLVVNCTSGGKLYLYDLVDIKKEASNPLKINE